jgi:tetratricopeptide (TPR) repeat protein
VDLVSALGHSEPPRSQYFVKLPTRYGELRVDILSPDPEAARTNGLVGDDAVHAHAMVNEAVARAQQGELADAEALLLETVRRYPYSYEAFGVLSDVCTSRGLTADAVYFGRQVVGLVPSYRNLTLLARALGQDGRLREAATVQQHLWQTRTEARPGEALEAVHGYLVTLSKLEDGGPMAEVCAQALAEYPGDPTIRYQQAFASLLLGRLPEAYLLVDRALDTLPAAEPLVPRFAQLRDSIAARLGSTAPGPPAAGLARADPPVPEPRPADSRPAEPRQPEPRQPELRQPELRPLEPRQPEPRQPELPGPAGIESPSPGPLPQAEQAFGLREIMAAIEFGHLPPADGGLTVVPGEGRTAVLAFTAHCVVAADVDPDWVRAQLPPGDLSAPLNPPFLSVLGALLDRRVNNIDLIAIAPRLTGSLPLPLSEVDAGHHPRVRRALRYREEVHVWATEGGLVVLGRGVGGRWELAVEVEPAHRGHGLGRALAVAGRHLVPGGAVWAQIAPGNAASVRAFLAAGFTPVGAEALLC